MFRFIVCLLAGSIALPTAAAAVPLEVYGRLPALDDVTISPNGKQLAYLTNASATPSIIVYNLDSSKVVAALNAGPFKIRYLQWADNDHLVISASQTTWMMGDVTSSKSEFLVAQSYSLSTNTLTPLLQGDQDGLNIIEGAPEIRTIAGHAVVFVQGIQFVEFQSRLTLYANDLVTGHQRIIEKGPADVGGWVVDENGTVVARIEYDNPSHRYTLSVQTGDRWVKADEVETLIDPPDVEGLSHDGKSLLVRTVEGGKYAFKSFSLADGSVEKKLLDFAYIVGNLIHAPNSPRIIGIAAALGDVKLTFYDRADQSLWDSVLKAFPGEIVTLAAWTPDKRKIVVRVDGNRDGSEYELIDLNTGVARDIGPAYQGIAPSDISEVRFITYAASDGLKIPAYLTIPSGRPQKNLPLIVLPHGGPESRDYPGFDWWSQALASRGYAVLQPEFRGSGGFGWEHFSAGFGEWGRKMQTDLSDGVRYLASQGLIDPKRVCIVGASYGGYAALAGPTLDRGVYRCAVSVSGISHLGSFMRWIKERQRTADAIDIRYDTRFMGVGSYDDPKLANISPLPSAAGADAPILLIHGSDDTVVPIVQSEDMEAGLRSAGKPVTFVRLKSEDHWLSRSDTREQMLQATVAFLEANNPPN